MSNPLLLIFDILISIKFIFIFPSLVLILYFSFMIICINLNIIHHEKYSILCAGEDTQLGGKTDIISFTLLPFLKLYLIHNHAIGASNIFVLLRHR